MGVVNLGTIFSVINLFEVNLRYKNLLYLHDGCGGGGMDLIFSPLRLANESQTSGCSLQSTKKRKSLH